MILYQKKDKGIQITVIPRRGEGRGKYEGQTDTLVKESLAGVWRESKKLIDKIFVL